MPYNREYQIDILGSALQTLEDPIWVVECRYRNIKANVKDIKKLSDAVEAVKKERDTDRLRGWFISVNGFSKNALEHARKNGILTSNKDQLNELLDMYGIKKIN